MLINRIKYIAAVVMSPARGQAGFLGDLLSAGLNLLGIGGDGGGQQQQPVVVTAPAAPSTPTWMPWAIMGGLGMFMMMFMVMVFSRK